VALDTAVRAGGEVRGLADFGVPVGREPGEERRRRRLGTPTERERDRSPDVVARVDAEPIERVDGARIRNRA